MISIIVPAHNEEQVIGRTLRVLLEVPHRPGNWEIIVVANGCTDGTADIARTLHTDVQVVETTVPSKANALNLGDKAATSFPRIYLDADVVLSMQSARDLTSVLSGGKILAASPGVRTIFPANTSWAVRLRKCRLLDVAALYPGRE